MDKVINIVKSNEPIPSLGGRINSYGNDIYEMEGLEGNIYRLLKPQYEAKEAELSSKPGRTMSKEDKIKRHKKQMSKTIAEINNYIRSRNESVAGRFFRTLGYLSTNGNINAFMPDTQADLFESKYKDVSGLSPVGHIIHLPKSTGGSKKWGIELRISYKLHDSVDNSHLEFGPFTGYVEPVSGTGDEYNINNNHFIWHLFSIGFRIGKNHDVDLIASNIPDIYKHEFGKGHSGNLI